MVREDVCSISIDHMRSLCRCMSCVQCICIDVCECCIRTLVSDSQSKRRRGRGKSAVARGEKEEERESQQEWNAPEGTDEHSVLGTTKC